jgi:hypothetical protein
MKVPTLSQSEMKAFTEARRVGESYDPEVIYTGSELSLGDELVSEFVEGVNLVLSEVKLENASSQEMSHSNFEKKLTARALRFFEALPPEAKFSPGFWSYVSFRIADAVEWRYPPNDKEGWSKNFVSSHSHSDFIDGLLPRIVVRGLIARDSSKALSLSGQDFWRSHILRVKTGFSKVVSIAFAEHVVDVSMPVSEQRIVAKRVRSARSNVIFEALDSSQAVKMLETLL